MAAAAYGAVVSLTHLLENLQHPSRQHLHYDKKQIQTLSENLTFLLAFLEDYSDIVFRTDDSVDLARQIAYAVDEAEEIIDYHVVDQLRQGSESSYCNEAEESDDGMAEDQLSQGSGYVDAEENYDYHAEDELSQGSESSYCDEAEDSDDDMAVDQLSQGSESSDFYDAEENIDQMAVDQLSQGSESSDYYEAEENDDNMEVDQLSQGSESSDYYDAEENIDELAVDLSSFREDLERLLNKIESIKMELMMVKDQKREVKAPSSAPPELTSLLEGLSLNPPSMVGFDDRLVHIMDQLTGNEADLQIVSITGMGGIGKTTLAENVFDHRCIVDRFDLRKWITISQSFSIRDVLISFVGGSENQENNELAEKFHKMLFGRRYLIVMDDMWSTEVWHMLRRCFPNKKNGSRVLVTTRLSNLAVSLGSHNPYMMDFLDEETSWKLFCIKTFGKQICPNPELEKIGKEIVACCKGLPLAIVVIGRLLGKSNMVRDDWELVAKDVLKSIDNSKDDGDCSNILSLSYKHLPIHLKPCFLYLRIFCEDDKIPAADLINYWVAEGFIKPRDGQTLEEVALEYLKDLINRNLILIHELDKYTGEISECKVHDLLRDLCLREYEKESFFFISKVVEIDYAADDATCILCNYRKASTWMDLNVCNVCNKRCSNRNRLGLVKVAVGVDQKWLKPTTLRYLRMKSSRYKFESIVLPLLWNLQYLELYDEEIQLPTTIWEMPQLRHLSVCVDRPFSQTGRKDCFSFEKLQLLRVVDIYYDRRACVEEILQRISNVKTLDIGYAYCSEEFHNFAQLHKLQNLACRNVTWKNLSFPNSLKSLELGYCDSPWQRMTIIGSLPNLEVLILVSTCGGPKWNPIEGEFLRPKTLSIEKSDLVWWNAEKYHFPRLELLELENMEYLEKIPSGIGDIDTLREIRVSKCTESTIQSAKEIVAEQRDYENEELQLVVDDIIHH